MSKVVRFPVNLDREVYEKNRRYIRILTRNRQDFVDLRKAMDDRRGVKKNGKPKVRDTDCAFTKPDLLKLAELSKDAAKEANRCEKELEKALVERMPIYEWLGSIDGVSAVTAGWICGEFNIFKAATPSKLGMFCGINPGKVHGVKSEGKGKNQKLIQTNILIRADKLTKGFVAPYNTKLRAALLGVMTGNFLKNRNEFAVKYYYPYKQRLENSDKLVFHTPKNGGKGKEMPWKDVSTGHRDRAAQRYMLKMFLQELYNVWRPLHGLEVRPPYMEEYLGKTHHTSEDIVSAAY